MDQQTENTVDPKEETSQEVPKEASKEAPKEGPKECPIPANNMEVKSEPESLAESLTKVPDVEIRIPGPKPNETLRTFLSSKLQGNGNPEPEDSPNNPEKEPLYDTDSNSKDEQSSDEDFQCASEEESDSASDEESDSASDAESSSDENADYDPTLPRPRKKGPPRERKKKAKTSAALTEKVKGLMTSNILSTANVNANANASNIPVSQKRDKAKALAEEISKLPTDNQPQAKKDMFSLIESSKRFTPSAKVVNMNWQVKGLNTLLKHHQLKAAAWMIDREHSNEEPNGGLLCDEMGLGKTLTVLAIIANEKITRRFNAPTLLVVPRSLVAQWLDQITVHCAEKISKDVIEYYTGSHTSYSNVVRVMEKRRIVITTYEQVCTSYPKLKPPVTIKTPEELEAWREGEYTRRAGPLHKVEWHRIVLDEAHSIKNKDSATSIAIRALNGRFKWALSGTPLHNGVEELYPYLHFIFTLERMEYETFLKKYSNGLHEILETVLHRSTYSTRLLGKPIVTLPGINNRVVEVELCQAEKHLYREIQDLGIAMLNGLAETKERQTRCILAVITMLRMFVSHPLLAQKFLKVILTQGVIKGLKAMAQEKGVTETSSGIILNLILAVGDKVAPRPRLPGDFSELHGIYHNKILQVRQYKDKFQEFLLRCCPCCEELIQGEISFVVTSCQHLYCKGCFDQLPDQNGKTDTITRVCKSCEKPIEEAGYSDDSPENSPKKSSPKKRKQSKPSPKGKKIFAKRSCPSFKKHVLYRDPSDDEWNEPIENEDDWISRVGNRMPSAKTTAVRDLVANWVKEDEDVKIVIFVQFLKTAQILQFMFDEENWKYALITGKVSPTSRDKQIELFGKDKDVKIMISSLKTGGVGLNLTMANKCILVDPWWNEAIQDQAYCRLYRIGQPRVVEYVQVVAKGSIDTWMINLQKQKAHNIHQLFSTDSLKEILGLSGDIYEKPEGGFSIFNSRGDKHAQTWVQAVESVVLNEGNYSEED
ncbi:Helicase, C-terminal [Penicillium expansum]|nr:Helicase, C-terminal [Penicillium expansum]KGO62514.1 Helicase, C-terminal [Penicillium expansum]